MRITGGEFSGRRLRVSRRDVRPTTDRTREALFSMLAVRIQGARVLDLFAGSGVVGLEALSRGADHVTWVEADRHVAKVLRENAAALPPHRARICVADVLRMVKNGFGKHEFDIIFADPPYGWGGGQHWSKDVPRDVRRAEGIRGLLAERIRMARCLKPGGLFVLEQAAKSGTAAGPGWRLMDQRVYGSTELLFYKEDHCDDEDGNLRGNL